MAKQTVFALLDHMKKWLGKKLVFHQENSRRESSKESGLAKDEDFKAVQKFVETIKQHNLAIASYECRAFARSLMHLEAHIRDKPDDLTMFLTQLQQVYGALNEPDYVYGLDAIRKQEPNLEELIHHHQVTGNFQVRGQS